MADPPPAERMACLQQVKRLDRQGTVPGYPTFTVISLGKERRGLLYHTTFSSAASDFRSEPTEVRAATRASGATLEPLGAEETAILDSGFDDLAV